MEKLSQNRIIIILILFIIFYFSLCYNNEEKNNNLRKLDENNVFLPDHPPSDGDGDLEKEKEKLEYDYKIKLEENNKLKKQIEKNIKYIKILITTGIIMFLIILCISIRNFYKCSKSKSSLIKINNSPIIQKSELENSISINEEKNKNNSLSNSSIKKSKYNLLNSSQSVNISNNISFSETNCKNSKYRSFEAEEKEKNYDAPKMADSNIIINDDNKTLTNNPDMFIPSRMDRILYQPYSKEEIK